MSEPTKPPSPDTRASLEQLRNIGRSISGTASLLQRTEYRWTPDEQQQFNRLCEWSRDLFTLADHLSALLTDVVRAQSQEEVEQEMPMPLREGADSVEAVTSRTAPTHESQSQLVNAATDLLAGISNGGNWQAWRAGNQAVNIKAKFPFEGEHCGASEVKGLPRAWSPHFCGLDVFSLPKEFNISRFKDADADFIAAAPRLVRRLLELISAPLPSITPDQGRPDRCIVCKTDYPTGGQQTGPVWGIWSKDMKICKRCVLAGRHAKIVQALQEEDRS